MPVPAPTSSSGPRRGGGADYTVRLGAFEGPLDLLLFLVRRAEVEITDIPIAEITEQYLGYLEQLAEPGGDDARGRRRRIDIEQAGEFLVMAATLMEIKSRMLSPRPQGGAAGTGDGGDGERSQAAGRDEPADPRAELVRQLLEYKRFRDATDRLEAYRDEWDHRYPAAKVRLAEAPVDESAPADEPVDIDDLQLVDLLEAFARIVESVDFSRVGEHRVVVDETPVEVHGERIVARLREAVQAVAQGGDGGVKFKSLFEKRTRSEMIGMFLALLELVKQQRIQVQQEAIHGEIVLRLSESTQTPTGADAAAAPPSASARGEDAATP